MGVESITSYSRNGLRDWLMQRVSAVIIGIYALFIVIYLLACPHLNYAHWKALFANPVMRISSVLVLLSILAHAWIGIWTVFTDYVKCACLRLVLQVLVVLALFSILIWGIVILWS